MDKPLERKILLRRLFYSDRDIYKVGRAAGISWFDRFKQKFERDEYAYFSDEERMEAVKRIATETPDDVFVEAVNRTFWEKERRYLGIDRFVGEHYYFDPYTGVKPENRLDELRREVRNALEETKGRGYYFLKAIVELYKEGKWDRAYGGASWQDILSKIREIGGCYPPPRDLVILKSYKIYYRTGSRRYPTHTIPEEMIPVVEEVLDRYFQEHEEKQLMERKRGV